MDVDDLQVVVDLWREKYRRFFNFVNKRREVVNMCDNELGINVYKYGFLKERMIDETREENEKYKRLIFIIIQRHDYTFKKN